MGDVIKFESHRPLPIVPEIDNYRDGMQYERHLDWFRGLSTSTLKRMWDSDDYEVHCDEIHWVMNERGEGRYVAV